MDFVNVGKLNKSFGIKGQIKVKASAHFTDLLMNEDVWYVDFRGDIIPYFVEKVEQGAHFLVKFEDIDNPESTRVITGNKIYLKKEKVLQEEVVPQDLTILNGYTIVAGNKKLIIQEIEEYPNQLMAVCSDSILIPLVEEWIIAMDHEKQTITMDLPDGLV